MYSWLEDGVNFDPEQICSLSQHIHAAARNFAVKEGWIRFNKTAEKSCQRDAQDKYEI